MWSSQGEKLVKRGIETTAVTQKVQQKYWDIACKANFFPPYLRQAAKIYVSTSYSVVRQETIEISEQRTAFVCFFAQEVDRCMKDCDKQRLQTTVSINLWKILAGHTGDWFDVKTASICTTELWDALKSFILTSLKMKVAPYPIIVSLDTLSSDGGRACALCKAVSKQITCKRQKSFLICWTFRFYFCTSTL